jgi:hypothetical protein
MDSCSADEGVSSNRRRRREKTTRWAFVCVIMYFAAFLTVHLSSSLRRPAANMLYWCYSDWPVLEAIEFYGFWPLRQIAYRVPGFMSHHYREAPSLALPAEDEGGV